MFSIINSYKYSIAGPDVEIQGCELLWAFLSPRGRKVLRETCPIGFEECAIIRGSRDLIVWVPTINYEGGNYVSK